MIGLQASPPVLECYAALLSSDELARAARFHFDSDRRRFIMTRAQLRQMLAPRLGVRPAEIQFEYGIHGKPSLGGIFAAAPVSFNVSHSEDLALIGITAGTDLGVDVEALRTLSDEEQLARRSFSLAEFAEYQAADIADRQNAFFCCWTRKEALIKALGQGLNYPLDAFDVSVNPTAEARLRRMKDLSGENSGWCIGALDPAPGYAAAVAVRGKACVLRIDPQQLT